MLKMIKYYDKLLLSLSEIENHPILLVHALTGCQLHCFHCLNHAELIEKKHDRFYHIDQVIEEARKQAMLFDYLVFSGGEFLLAPIDDLIADLTQVKQAVVKPIIVYSNGIAFDKIQTLTELHLVDGFHVDMKLPFHLLTAEDADLVELTMGIKITDNRLFKDVLSSFEYVVKTDRGLNRIRSVHYPFLGDEAFMECRAYVDRLNQRYQKHVPYDVHHFIYDANT
jgi:pyruvate-formate lyase-activating enzyme